MKKVMKKPKGEKPFKIGRYYIWASSRKKAMKRLRRHLKIK